MHASDDLGDGRERAVGLALELEALGQDFDWKGHTLVDLGQNRAGDGEAAVTERLGLRRAVLGRWGGFGWLMVDGVVLMDQILEALLSLL